VNIGRRHWPLNAVFQNGPNWGHDVFIPLDWVIGGREQVGNGWRMLMECLAAGRAISLPSSNVGMAKLAVRGTGAYSAVRRAVPHGDRQVRRRSGSARAHGRQPVCDGRGTPLVGPRR